MNRRLYVLILSVCIVFPALGRSDNEVKAVSYTSNLLSWQLAPAVIQDVCRKTDPANVEALQTMSDKWKQDNQRMLDETDWFAAEIISNALPNIRSRGVDAITYTKAQAKIAIFMLLYAPTEEERKEKCQKFASSGTFFLNKQEPSPETMLSFLKASMSRNGMPPIEHRLNAYRFVRAQGIAIGPLETFNSVAAIDRRLRFLAVRKDDHWNPNNPEWKPALETFVKESLLVEAPDGKGTEHWIAEAIAKAFTPQELSQISEQLSAKKLIEANAALRKYGLDHESIMFASFPLEASKEVFSDSEIKQFKSVMAGPSKDFAASKVLQSAFKTQASIVFESALFAKYMDAISNSYFAMLKPENGLPASSKEAIALENHRQQIFSDWQLKLKDKK